MTLFRWLMVAALLVPWLARAGDADDFAAASRSTQAALLQTWATTPDAARLPLLVALGQENLVVDTQKHPFAQRPEGVTALGSAATPVGTVKPLRLTNRLRNLAAAALATHRLVS
ncbi:urea ABC transporter permease subunit UrtB, partial [Cronobacter sakazakii]